MDHNHKMSPCFRINVSCFSVSWKEITYDTHQHTEIWSKLILLISHPPFSNSYDDESLHILFSLHFWKFTLNIGENRDRSWSIAQVWGNPCNQIMKTYDFDMQEIHLISRFIESWGLLYFNFFFDTYYNVWQALH